MTSRLLRNVRLPGTLEPVSLFVADGHVTALAAHDTAAGSAAVTDGEGAWVIPGLWDAHVHFTQWALMRDRLDLGAATSAAQVLQLLGARLAERGSQEVLSGYGFRDALWPDSPTLAAIDAVADTTPVVLVSGDLHCAWVNTAGAAYLGASTDSSGLIRESAWFAASERLSMAASPDSDAQPHAASGADLPGRLSGGPVGSAVDAAAARGIVGIVDLEWADNTAVWSERMAAGIDRLRVRAGVYPDRLDAAIAAGLRTGQAIEGTSGLLTLGPLKVIADGSLNTRTAHCSHPYPGTNDHGAAERSVDEMAELVSRAYAAGIASTIHAIGDLANAAALDAFEAAGRPGTIEHAQLLHPRDLSRFGALGVVASVQPEHAMDDRDVVDRYWSEHPAVAFPLAALIEAGATLRLGSDAPVAPLDPWVTMAAAVERERDGREPWNPQERITPAAALAASTGGNVHLRAGDEADLVLVEHDPLSAPAGHSLRTMSVLATMVAGRWTFGAGPLDGIDVSGS